MVYNYYNSLLFSHYYIDSKEVYIFSNINAILEWNFT